MKCQFCGKRAVSRVRTAGGHQEMICEDHVPSKLLKRMRELEGLVPEEGAEGPAKIKVLQGRIEALEATIEPVRDWYEGDHGEIDEVVMLTLAIKDLQEAASARTDQQKVIADLEKRNKDLETALKAKKEKKG